jgi:cytochrome c biogenesis protein CcmG, thiol:disulfide interchange protein DsbE
MGQRRRRTAAAIFAVFVLAAIVVVGLREAPHATSTDQLSIGQMRAEVRSASPGLAALHAQASQLLPGGYQTLSARMRSLRGHPVVMNLWASWCPPCRAESVLFQRISTEFGRQVAFLGVDSNDQDEPAAQLLRDVPVVYPSYVDRPGRMADELHLQGLPATAFYDSDGRQVSLHQGQYLSLADLRRDVSALAR